jgi:arsenate reductase (thioredoxin)
MLYPKRGYKMLKLLFLCTGNSCRSVMAEGLLNHLGEGRFIAYSAGSFPTGLVHPLSLQILKSKGIATEGYYSKSWDEFTDKHIDIVITVCDSAAGESCPIFPGKPVKAHWGAPDPAKFIGTDAETNAEFTSVCNILEKRIRKLLELPAEKMGRAELQDALSRIGKDV